MMILQWLASPEWAGVIKALLHTLWEAALAAAVLALLLRRLTNPAPRYRCALTALAGVAVAALVTWAVVSDKPAAPTRPHANTAAAGAALAEPSASFEAEETPVLLLTRRSTLPATTTRWTAWLALAWLLGAGLMLARAALQVAGAEQLRRRSRPLENEVISQLAVQTRRAIGLTRRVRMAVTDRLTSPAVVGVLVPTLVLPLTLVTTLTPDQIRFVLLHELAHVRRGDYVVSLFQLLVEALLFFNPAVWWINCQIRMEREACCDAVATELSGDCADYARTLVHVAEKLLDPLPEAASGFGGPRRSSLGERVRRLLVPGYRPALRLTWRAMAASLLVGGSLLLLSAVGTRITVAAILSPQQRIERIERKMEEYGQPPRAVSFKGQNAPQVQVSGRVRTADGSPVPRWVNLNIESSIPRSSWGTATVAENGNFHCSIRQGTIYIAGSVSNFAPVVIGPFETLGTNLLENVGVVLERGFNIRVVATDADTSKPIPGAVLSTRFWWPGGHGTTFPWLDTTADGQGQVTLSHCANLPLEVTLEAAGYEIIAKRFEKLSSGEVLRVSAHRGAPLAGEVLDKKTGKPIADATVRLLYQAGPGNSESFSWDDPRYVLATTDSDGHFLANRLRRDFRYSIGVAAPGRESVLLRQVQPARSNLVVRLGPELVIHGRVTGDFDLLRASPSDPRLYIRSTVNNSVNGQRQFLSELHLVEVRDGVGYFQFTNRLAGSVAIEAAGHTFKREVSTPVADWLIDLSALAKAQVLVVQREVVFRFQSASGVPPRGTVHVTIPQNLDPTHLTAIDKEFEISNGEVRVEMPVGGRTDIRPGRTIGYWFKELSAGVEITNGTGPMVINIPLVPAGAIYARAQNADGSPGADLMFSIVELKRSPLRDQSGPLGEDGDSYVTGQGPRQWISGPLPLGGTYEIVGSHQNSFCVSKPITLTEERPDAEVTLQFAAARNIDGVLLDPGGKPVVDAEVIGTFTINGDHSYGLRSTYTDEKGHFHLENATPGIGQYFVQVGRAGCRSEIVPVDFPRLPMTFRLEPGLKLSGRVVDAGTGYVVPDAEVRAFTYSHKPMLPSQTVRTDAQGRFQFDTLGDAVYTLYVNGANLAAPASEGQYQAGESKPIKLEVVLYPGTSLTSRPAPQHSPGQATAGAPASGYATAWKAPAGQTNLISSSRARQDIIHKLQNIRLESVSFAGRPLSEVVSKLSEEVKRADPDRKGVNFLVNPSPFVHSASSAGQTLEIDPNTGQLIEATNERPMDMSTIMVTIEPALTNARLLDVFDAIVRSADKPIKYSIVDHGVVFSPKGPDLPKLHIRSYKIDSRILLKDLHQVNGAATNAPVSEVLDSLLNFFDSHDLNLRPGTGRNLFLNLERGTLLVRATEEELGKVEKLLPSLMAQPPQVNLRVRFVEIPGNANVAGFDWYLGNLLPKNASSSEPDKDASRSTAPNSPTSGVFPGAAGSRLPAGASGSPGSGASAKGLVGILTEPQYRVVLHALEQREGADLVNEGQVTTLSGRQAQIQTVDLQSAVTGIKPQALMPPGVNSSNDVYEVARVPLGPVLDVIPAVRKDGATIELKLSPSQTEFLGYDPSTNSAVAYVNGKPQTVQVPRPRFRVHAMSSDVIVWDGQTVVLGNLPEVSAPQADDLGHPRTNLLVFVTTTLIDPAGNRIHTDDQLPFARDSVPPQGKPTGTLPSSGGH